MPHLLLLLPLLLRWRWTPLQLLWQLLLALSPRSGLGGNRNRAGSAVVAAAAAIAAQ